MSSHHDLVVKEAYYLWEKAGYPHGRDVEFWVEAERIVSKRSKKVEDKAPEAPKKEKSPAAAPVTVAKPVAAVAKPKAPAKSKKKASAKSKAS